MAFTVKDLTAKGVDAARAEEYLKDETLAKLLLDGHENGLRQSDYDRFMNAKKAEFTAQEATLNEARTKLESDRTRINEQYLGALKSREETESALATLRAKAKTATDIYGVDLVKELFGEDTMPVPSPKPGRSEPPPQPTDDFSKRLEMLEDLFRTNVSFETEMHDIVRQHMELFPDKPLLMKELVDDAVKQRRSPTQVWDDKFGATARREEQKADRYRAEGREAEKSAWEKKISEGLVNPLRTDVPMSAVFAAAGKKSGNSPSDRNANASASVQSAVNALVSGKYRPHYGQREQ